MNRRFFAAFLVLLALSSLNTSAVMTKAASVEAALDRRVAATPLLIENVGQFAPRVRFLMLAGDEALWLAEDGIYAPDGALLIAAESGSRLEPLAPSPATVSFFRGEDPSAWRSAVPVWSGVRWVGFRPERNLIIDGRLRWEGDDSSSVALSGPGPAVSLRGAGDLLYASYIGGGSWEEGHGVALDAAGNTYVSGWTQSADLGATPGSFDNVYGGARDAFVAKFGPAGLAYLAFIGGSDEEWCYSLAVGPDSSAYLTGHTKSSNFATTPGSLSPNYRGGPSDGFLVKVAPDGRSLSYSTFVGGSGEDVARSVAVDASGNAYLTGWTESADFPHTPGALDPSLNSDWDAFALKLNAAGSQLLYGTYLGGSFEERGLDIAVDPLGFAYITGYTMSSDFPLTSGAYDPIYDAGLGDAFVSKLNPAGSALAYSTFLGGDGEDKARGIAVDAAGCAYIVGMTRSSDFAMTPGAFDQTPNGFQDIFVVKLNPAGSAPAYATLLGGIAEDQGYGIAIDALGGAYVVGSTKSGDYPTTAGAYDTVFNGKFTYQSDPVLTRLNPEGSALLYSTFLGGTLVDVGYGVATDSQQTAYLVGYTASSNFPSTEDAFDGTLGGQGDAFLIKLDTRGQMPTPTATRSTTASRTPTATRSATPTATLTATPTYSPTPSDTPTATPTSTASATSSPTSAPSATLPWQIRLPLIIKGNSML